MLLYVPVQIQKIRIGHDGKNPGSGWFLDKVSINVPSYGTKYEFACHRWLDKNQDDGKTEIELEPSHVEKGSISKSILESFFLIFALH